MDIMDIKNLLKKKKWTGEEVGKAIILNMIHHYKHTLQGTVSQSGLFTQAQISTMINSITDRTQGQVYNRYVGLNNWISQNHALAAARYEQLRGEINRLLLIISTATVAEDEYKYIEKLPAIMTQKQYDEIRTRRIEEQLTDENGEELAYDVFNLIEFAISHFVMQLQTEPEPDKANPLKAVKEKYQTAPVNSPRILSRYNDVMAEGYYTLPDGRRSDQMSYEEWKRALTPPKQFNREQEISAALKSNENKNEDEAEILKNISISDKALNRALERNRAIFNGATEQEADRIVYESEIKAGLHPKITWHAYEEPPEDLTKWDIIESGNLFEYYPVLTGENCDTYIEQAEDFKQEFQELFTALAAGIDKTFLKGQSGISELPVNEWETTLFSLRELYNKDFFGFRAFIESDTNIFDGNNRAIYNGIAILRPSNLLNKSPRIDENDYYTEPERVRGLSISTGLEQFTPLNEEDYLINIEKLEISRRLIEEGYYFLLGYDKAIELIADRIGLPDFCLFKLDTAPVLENIEILNNLIFTLYSKIKGTDYMDKAAKEQKLKVLHDYFQPLKGKEFVIPKAAIAKAKRLLKDMEAFRVQDNVFLGLLAMQKGRF